MILRKKKRERVSREMAGDAVRLMETFKRIFDIARKQGPKSAPVTIEVVIPPIKDPRVVWLGWAIMNDYVNRLLGAGTLDQLKPIVDAMRKPVDARSDRTD